MISLCVVFYYWAYFITLGAFSTFLNATIGCIMSVLLSILPHGTTRLPLNGFSWNLVYEYFSKFCRKNSQLSLNSEKNNGHFHEDGCTFMAISRWIILRQTFYRKSKLLFSILFFFKYHALYEIMWKIMVGAIQAAYDKVIRCTHFTSWITNATEPHSEYVILIAFLWQQWFTNVDPCYVYIYTAFLL